VEQTRRDVTGKYPTPKEVSWGKLLQYWGEKFPKVVTPLGNFLKQNILKERIFSEIPW
jgi:hypothetical protein